MRCKLASTILLLLPLGFASVLGAHAILVAASPRAGEAVNGPAKTVKLRFNSRVDSKRSMLVLVGPNGELRKLVIGAQSSPDSIDSMANRLESGSYVLRWQVLAVDGHITRGEVPFRVR
jgi:copper resistance protein C